MLGQTTRSHLQQTGFDLGRIVRQLVAATAPVVGQLQPIECARPRQGNPTMRRIEPILSQRIALVAGRRQQWIQPQVIVIVEVFIAQSQPVDPLSQHLLHGMVNIYLLTVVLKALRQGQGQSQVRIDLTQQQRTPITGEGATGKIGHDFTRTQVLKKERLFLTVCLRRSGDWRFHLAE